MRYEDSAERMVLGAVIAAAIASTCAFRTDRFGPHLGDDLFVPAGVAVRGATPPKIVADR